MPFSKQASKRNFKFEEQMQKFYYNKNLTKVGGEKGIIEW